MITMEAVTSSVVPLMGAANAPRPMTSARIMKVRPKAHSAATIINSFEMRSLRIIRFIFVFPEMRCGASMFGRGVRVTGKFRAQ